MARQEEVRLKLDFQGQSGIWEEERQRNQDAQSKQDAQEER